MRKALNIFHQGKGGLESLSQNISSILKDYLNVESIPANSSFASVWRTAIRNEIILVHRTSSILKVFPILLFYPKIVIFFHHFMARKRKKDPYHRIIYSRVNKFVVLSKRIKQQVKQNWCIGEERVYVAYPGVDTKKLRRSEDIRKVMREKYGICEKEKVFGVIGRIGEEKNQGILLNALKLSGVYATALIAGPVESEKYFQKIKNLSSELKIVLIPKFIEDVVGLLNAIDFLVITSQNEPFGLIGLEAMACSTPVLAPDNSGIAELVSDGFDSFTYSANSVQSLAETITKVVYKMQDIPQVSQRAREKVEKHFSFDSYGQRLIKIIMR